MRSGNRRRAVPGHPSRTRVGKRPGSQGRPDASDPSLVYRLTVKCVNGLYLSESCVRVIEITDDSTLEDLHLAIQEAVSFDKDHLYDFYAGRNYRDRKRFFRESDDWDWNDAAFANLQLRDIYPLEPPLKLYYWFDFGDDWIFEIRKARKETPAKPDVDYPRVVEARGPNPEQYPMGE
jgi:hypothetical protein